MKDSEDDSQLIEVVAPTFAKNLVLDVSRQTGCSQEVATSVVQDFLLQLRGFSEVYEFDLTATALIFISGCVEIAFQEEQEEVRKGSRS